MTAAQSPLVVKKLVSGREVFICDNFINGDTALRIGNLLKTLTYRRSERSRAQVF